MVGSFSEQIRILLFLETLFIIVLILFGSIVFVFFSYPPDSNYMHVRSFFDCLFMSFFFLNSKPIYLWLYFVIYFLVCFHSSPQFPLLYLQLNLFSLGHFLIIFLFSRGFRLFKKFFLYEFCQFLFHMGLFFMTFWCLFLYFSHWNFFYMQIEILGYRHLFQFGILYFMVVLWLELSSAEILIFILFSPIINLCGCYLPFSVHCEMSYIFLDKQLQEDVDFNGLVYFLVQ